MTDEYNFEIQKCSKCHKVEPCIEKITNSHRAGIVHSWYCKFCYGWTKTDAKIKDEVYQIMVQCGIEDIEKC